MTRDTFELVEEMVQDALTYARRGQNACDTGPGGCRECMAGLAFRLRLLADYTDGLAKRDEDEGVDSLYGEPERDEPGDIDGDDAGALASAGLGTDEDYGYYGEDEE